MKISVITRTRRSITWSYLGDEKESALTDEPSQMIDRTDWKARNSHQVCVQCKSFTSRDQRWAALKLYSECQWSAVDQYHTLKSRRKDREAEKKSLNKLETLVCDALDANGKSGRTIPFSGLQQLSRKLSSRNVHIFVWESQGWQIQAHHVVIDCMSIKQCGVYTHPHTVQFLPSWLCELWILKKICIYI